MGLVTTELILTDRRLLGRTGSYRKRKLNIPHKEIEVAIAQRGLLGMMFNYGTVTVGSRDGKKFKFRGIARPHDIEREIDRAAEIAILGRELPHEDRYKVIISKKPIPMLDSKLLAPQEAAAKSPPLASSPPSAIEEKPPEKIPDKKIAVTHKDPNHW